MVGGEREKRWEDGLDGADWGRMMDHPGIVQRFHEIGNRRTLSISLRMTADLALMQV